MSFGGLGGLAGGVLIQPASIHPAGRYVAVGPSGQPDLTAPVNNVFWRKSGPGSTPPGIEDANQGAFQYISILPIAVPIVEPNFLEECTAVGGSAGTFTTAAPLFGQHGLPVNYGRGRNRWRPGSVRMNAPPEPGAERPSSEPLPHDGRVHALAARADEQRPLRGPGDLRAGREPDAERRACLGADRHGARLPALARHGDLAVAQNIGSVGNVQAHELGEPQARRVAELEHGPVARFERPVSGVVEERLRLVEDLRDLGRLGELTRAPRGA